MGDTLKRGKIVSVLLLIALVSVLFLSSVFSIVSQTPHGIKGYVLYDDGTQVPAGTDFSINDTTSDFFIVGTTNGPGGITGWYSVSVNGTDGDLLVIQVSNATHYGLRLVELEGDMKENITLNVNNNAPKVQPVKEEGHERGVWITPDLPANNSDIVCNYEDIIDPNGDLFDVNYSWVKNGLVQSNSIHELLNDSSTLFLARYDGTTGNGGLDADFARGSVAPLRNGTYIFQTGKVTSAINISTATAGGPFYSTSGNFNISQGTIEFWFKPNFAPNSFSGAKYLFTTNGTTSRTWMLMIGASKVLRILARSTLDVPLDNAATGVDWGAGEWHHLAFTWSEQLKGVLVKISQQVYVDGRIIVDDTTASTSYSITPNSFAVGSRYVSPFLSSDGTIDEFRVSDRERSTQEIFRDYSESIIRHQNTVVGDVYRCEVSAKDNSSLNGYAISSSDFTINDYEVDLSFFDGSNESTNNSLQAGKPIGLNLALTRGGIAVADAEVTVSELNGLTTFAPIQGLASNVSNKQIGFTQTNSNGLVNLTFVPSGGRRGYEANLGFYGVKVDVSVGEKSIFSKNLLITSFDREPEFYTAYYSILFSQVPNFNDFIGTAYNDALLAYYFKERFFVGEGGSG